MESSRPATLRSLHPTRLCDHWLWRTTMASSEFLDFLSTVSDNQLTSLLTDKLSVQAVFR